MLVLTEIKQTAIQKSQIRVSSAPASPWMGGEKKEAFPPQYAVQGVFHAPLVKRQEYLERQHISPPQKKKN